MKPPQKNKFEGKEGQAFCALNHQSMEKYLTSVIANGKAEI
jgi:hypothetical protein